jgi:3-mercaptopyruvate sulfurtransferase SseA
MNMILKLGAGALIVGTAITAAGCSNSGAATHTADAAAAGAPPARSSPSIPSPQNPDDKTPRISVQDAKKLIAEGKAVIIDVRPVESYNMSHIKGAPNIPLSKLEAGDFNDVPKDKLIIAYCG